MEKEEIGYVMSCWEAKNEKTRVSWEDKATGDYYRYNAAEKMTDTEYRKYENVSIGNKTTGHFKRFYTEERYPVGQTSKEGKRESVNFIQHY